MKSIDSARSNIPGNKTPDFLANGIRMELKTLTGTGLHTPVMRIQDGFRQGAETVIIDGRNTGLTLDAANTVIERALGKYGGELPGVIEIWTTEGIILGDEIWMATPISKVMNMLREE